MRKYTDTRGLGRKGLELPPFYGVSRVFGVYQASDYGAPGNLGSAYNPTTRVPTGSGATNLLRQDFQGPTFWIEIDDDGDSTFILNADALDLSKCPVSVTDFDDVLAQFVIEASIFGFDRGSFDLTQPFRLVMTRPLGAGMRTQAANTVTRSLNIGIPVDSPTSVLPGPSTASDQVVVNFSRTPYQGDAFGTQANYVDSSYMPGCLTSATAAQIVTTRLDEAALTRPNQKALEVLASIAFETTLGTGRISGDLPSNPATAIDFRAVGYEDPSVYPPASALTARPKTLPGAFTTTDSSEAGTAYLGMTDRLPLGALLRDKDFRGGIQGSGSTHIGMFSVFHTNTTGVAFSAPSVGSSLEVSEVPLSMADAANGAPGEVIVHVDGEVSNYSLLTNYRTTRGGSAFSAGGDHPGGEVAGIHGRIQAVASHTNILSGNAYLVRNAVTLAGSTEVSAGDELMLLVVTTAQRLKDSTPTLGYTAISTNGYFEGYAAADLYRIEGRPLLTNNVHMYVDPSTITLSKNGTPES